VMQDAGPSAPPPTVPDSRNMQATARAVRACYRHVPKGSRGAANVTGSPVDVIVG
jgi:hypothetical protein